MGNNLTGAQKFWCLVCIIWLILIFVAYRGHFHTSAWAAIIVLFVGGFPLMTILIYLARSKDPDSHSYRPRNIVDPLPILASSMVSARVIAPEPREPPLINRPYDSIVDSLLTFVYQKDGKAEGDDCVVCLGQLRQGEMVAKLRFCSHLFHEKCINRWLRLHKTCPLCRSRVDRQIMVEEPMV